MNGKSITIDFGSVFSLEADQLCRRIEKNIQLNVGEIIDEGAYKFRLAAEKPMRLKVTIELAEV